jgi:tRNA (guanosine-2'-O-)-methyltransferase
MGVLEAHVVSLPGRPRTFNKTAKGYQKWVPLPAPPLAEEGEIAEQLP